MINLFERMVDHYPWPLNPVRVGIEILPPEQREEFLGGYYSHMKDYYGNTNKTGRAILEEITDNIKRILENCGLKEEKRQEWLVFLKFFSKKGERK